MKKSTVIKLLAPIMTGQNNRHPSYDVETQATYLLQKLEELGILKPKHRKLIVRKDIECMPYEDLVEVDGWEQE